MDNIDEGIVKIVGERGSATFSEIKKVGGWSWQAAHEHVEKLVEEGVLSERVGGFPKTRRLFLTEKGRLIYEAIKRREAAEEAVNLIDLADTLLEDLRKSAPHIKIMLQTKLEDYAKKIAEYYGNSLAGALLKPYDERMIEAAERFISGIKVIASLPPPQGEGEEEAFIEALLAFLSHLIKNGSFREKISREKKLTFILNIELPSLTESDLQSAIFLTLIHQEMRRKPTGFTIVG